MQTWVLLSAVKQYKVGLKCFGLEISWILLRVKKKNVIVKFLESLLTFTILHALQTPTYNLAKYVVSTLKVFPN